VYFVPYTAQDCRVVPVPLPGPPGHTTAEGFLAVFTLSNPTNSVMPGVAVVVKRPANDPNGHVLFGPPWRLYPPEWPAYSGKEKNWSPFVHNSTNVYFIKSINPLVVCGVREYDAIVRDAANETLHVVEGEPERAASTFVVSAAPPVPFTIDWGHGHMRGGSPAVLVNDSYYLSFFHTATRLIGSGYTTYFMGAYAFSRDPPFHLLAVSRYPIIDDALYLGPWNTRFPNRRIDYVVRYLSLSLLPLRHLSLTVLSALRQVFPMHFDLRGDWVHVTIGHQDAHGWLLTLPLEGLLWSMRNVSDTWDAVRSRGASHTRRHAARGRRRGR
jgi:hypothetical protein